MVPPAAAADHHPGRAHAAVYISKVQYDSPGRDDRSIRTNSTWRAVNLNGWCGMRTATPSPSVASVWTAAPRSASTPVSAGETPDPREAQITRLKAENAKLRERLAASERAVDELTDFRGQALARLAAQHEEIVRLRESVAGSSPVRRLPAPRTTVTGNCS
ncbi:hypothetical protein [Streptomyces sp. NPDC047869]|uniref:hypothetical protein n=1 Tax=Streptomyces sp. NPDC047869 TaxID=3154709 RepID=UPI003452537D